MSRLYNALIRTHHITSRKKVAKLKQAANAQDVFVLIRYGGAPGVMYVEGQQEGVEDWVGTVNNLRYKDYQLVARPEPLQRETPEPLAKDEVSRKGLFESESVKDFGSQMQRRRVYAWWRRGMGFDPSASDRL